MFIRNAIHTVEQNCTSADTTAVLEKSADTAVTSATPAPAALCTTVLNTLFQSIILVSFLLKMGYSFLVIVKSLAMSIKSLVCSEQVVS